MVWLERFSGNSTSSWSPPPPQNRSYSPAPRRPSHLTPEPRRPSFTPRSSSLNPGSGLNQPTNSLHSPRIPHGSGLKPQIPPPTETTNPLKILEEIIGRPVQKGVLENGTADDFAELERPSQLSEDIDFKGLGLQAFTEAADRVTFPEGPDGPRVSAQTVEECECV